MEIQPNKYLYPTLILAAFFCVYCYVKFAKIDVTIRLQLCIKKLYLYFFTIFATISSSVNEKLEKYYEEDREIHYANLQLFDICMKQVDIFYWVDKGTALGFIRDGEIIRYDSDVDVAMAYENKDKYYKECLPLLLQNGFKVMRDKPHSVIRNNCCIDVDFIDKGKASKAYDLLQPFSLAEVRGIIYNAPSMRYIQFLYGKNWTIRKR